MLPDWQCGNCGKTPAEVKFGSNTRSRSGLDYWCRPCRTQQHATWVKNNPERMTQAKRESHIRLKARVLDGYGGVCSCCGEDNPGFLTIDHVNTDGAEHRREIGSGSERTYRWLIKNDFPDGFCVMCANCNMGRYWNGGICPHLGEVMPDAAA